MIGVVFLFGPYHGHTEYRQPPLQPEVRIAGYEQPVPMFQEYRFGEPYGPPRPSMMREMHVYVLHDVLDMGTEEVATYLHREDCCDKDYSHSEDYKRNKPVSRDELPRFQDPAILFDRPRKRRLNLGDPDREKGNI